MAMVSEQLSAHVYCREHPDVPLLEDYHAGDMICTLCGLVVGDRVIDVRSEWNVFRDGNVPKDLSRVGAAENPLLEGESVASTMIVARRDTVKDEFGKPVYRNRHEVSSSISYLCNAFAEISQMAERLNLPKTLVILAKRLRFAEGSDDED